MAILQPLVTDLHSFSVILYTYQAAPQRDHRWDPHLHSFHQFDVTVEGRSALEFDNGLRIEAQPGTGILIPPMVRHNHQTDTFFRVGMFKFSLAPGGWAALGPRPLQIQLSETALAAVREAGAARDAKAPWQDHQAVAALTLCLVEAVRAVPSSPAPGTVGRAGASAGNPVQQQLGEILEAIEAAPFDGWTVAGLADRCHLTADHFTKRFREALEIGPQEYLLRARIRAAARALASHQKPSIKAIAETAGYASVHSFSRAFRQVTGLSPAKFRRQSGDL
ncbi:MAG TPA: AraC family transcriptional regulator [Planctomycetota bacterium]|nr:AraC family transcriptional regulator [Planctomycetota bacterium]